MHPGRILIVDDDPTARKILDRLLRKEGYEATVAGSGREALALLDRQAFDLVLTDLVMEDMTGMELLPAVKAKYPEVEVILITGYSSIPSAIEAMKKGAYHYIEKPMRPDEVCLLVRKAMEKSLLRKEVKDLRAQIQTHYTEPAIVGESRAIMEVLKLAKRVARTDCNVVLTGESGTGKELAANLIHFHSRRRRGKFLAINCGAFAEDLLSNELFGHEKGAFTGAVAAKVGLLEAASQGTLLLDEVGDMPLSMQVKLLRAIQEQEVMRVGATKPSAIDVRIIAATNKDLKKAVSAGLFRQDLYFRLNVISIHMPPLRERRKDIPLLAHHFLHRAARRSDKEVHGFSEEAMKLLLDYYYPGNVRELENIVERAVAMALDEKVQVKDLPNDLSEMVIFSFDPSPSRIKPLRVIQDEYIQWVLTRVEHNKSKAAKLLGIDRASLWRHVKRFEIQD